PLIRNSFRQLSGPLPCISPEGKKWYSQKHGLPDGLVHDMLLDKNGRLWLATNNGIAWIDDPKEEKVQVLQAFNGTSVHVLAMDHEQRLWMGGPKGLYCWDGKNMFTYSRRDGLPSNDVRSLLLDCRNRLWIGSSKGLTSLNLNHLPLRDEFPVLLLDRPAINGVSLSKMEEIRLKPKEAISWTFRAIYFQDADAVNFRYRLRATDPWRYTRQRKLEFSNLAHGEYNFQLQTSAGSNVWGNEDSVQFIVLPQWWQDWRILTVLLIGATLFLLLLFRLRIVQLIRKAEKDKAQAEKLAQLELKSLLAQMNPHFIFNALNAIQSYILENEAILSHHYLGQFSKLMRMFLESSRKEEHSLAEELEMLRLYVKMESLCYEGRFNHEIETDPAIWPEEQMLPTMLIQPFVENAIRHGILHKQSNDGELRIRFFMQKNHLVCEVSDNGIGRKNAMSQKKDRFHVSRGMEIVNERIRLQEEKMHTRIRLKITELDPENSLEPGTLVRIVVPISSEI
ncbi:MAG: histidine kinase, partial [Bacteroidota bacterium]